MSTKTLIQDEHGNEYMGHTDKDIIGFRIVFALPWIGLFNDGWPCSSGCQGCVSVRLPFSRIGVGSLAVIK